MHLVETSCIRFLIAPYSLFVSMALALALAPPIYLSHYLSFSLIQVDVFVENYNNILHICERNNCPLFQASASIIAAVTPETVLDLIATLQPYCYLPIGQIVKLIAHQG